MTNGTAFAIGAWFLLGLLAMVTTFGVGAFLNMVLRRWWVSVCLYAAFTVYVLVSVAARMSFPEWVLFLVGWLGSLLAAWTVHGLKKRGYPLFS
ncbi:MAG: hypothetical protein K6T81_03880 [Alicyclobacillus macrosporangiidus]|uniref:hypothetical protein n=1 Tax=Alicyclobacillus TaxID=29330 RepID=UPI00041749AA|nr:MULTISPECIES: hypothetical protein [Alicyclobacillus]MCL6597859.1 hypothetical protein [Alicyclobacillus macrosporangiidus]